MHQANVKMDHSFKCDILEDHDKVVLVEGPFDCMTLDQHGIPSVGVMGAHRISKITIEALLDKKVYICFDSEPSSVGIKASYKTAEKLMKYGIESLIIKLPYNGAKVDVNDFFKNHTLKDFKKAAADATLYNKEPKRYTDTNTTRECSVDIISVAQRYYELEYSGGHYKMPCLFHDDKNPSLIFYSETNTMFCFGCGKWGNTITLIRKAERDMGNNIKSEEAMQIARSICGS